LPEDDAFNGQRDGYKKAETHVKVRVGPGIAHEKKLVGLHGREGGRGGARPRFAKDVADGDAANEQATEADAANTQFRTVGGLSQFLADVTKVRDEVFVALDKIRTANPSLPKDFAKSFFRATTKAETPEEVQTKLAARQKAKADAVKRKADLKAAQTQMKALKKQITGLKK